MTAGHDPTNAVPDWSDRAAALAAELTAAGKLWSPAWNAAVRAVPRHPFVPLFYERHGDRFEAIAAEGPTTERWRDKIYTNTALITQLAYAAPGEFPEFLSSSSAPGLMTRMLESLDIHDGHRVLEIGTGTGWNAGLLCHRLGDDHVFSIDIDPTLVDLAAARLAGLDQHPTLVSGDGSAGLAAHAPFDRIIATCSVPAIPWAWVEQTAPGGVILADVRVGLSAGNLVRLTRVATGRAEGMFDAGQASFMSLRHAPGPSTRIPITRPNSDAPAVRTRTVLDPRTPFHNPVVWFLTALGLGSSPRIGYCGGDPQHAPDAVSITAPDGSRAEITIAADETATHAVHETGPVRLWQLVENTHQQWDHAGRPDWSRLGLTVTPTRQTVYTDDPDNPLATLTIPSTSPTNPRR